MSMLDDMKDKLVAQGVTETIKLSRVGDVGNDSGTDTQIALFQYSGVDPVYVPEQPKPKYEYPRLQVLTRSVRDQDAEALAYECFNILSQVTNEVINTHNYIKVAPVGSPFMLQRDEEERSIWACNYRITRETE